MHISSGQDHAVEAVSNAVRIARAGLHSHKKPIGCFLFLGPSGVGTRERGRKREQRGDDVANYVFMCRQNGAGEGAG